MSDGVGGSDGAGDVGSVLGGGATLPEAPGRGAYRALGLRGVLMVCGVVLSGRWFRGRPGSEHLPDGIEFDLAEIASGTTKTTASIALDLKDSYFHFNALRQSGTGVIR